MDHTIVHFEIPADDVAKLKNFYGDLFGWKMEKVPGFESMDYHMVTTVPVDENMKPLRRGVNGGIYKKQDQQSKFTYYVQVESADEYSKKIEELGGKITAPKMEIPNMGYVVFALDPEGNSFSIFEEKTG
ncbi:MAG: VOC family protein [Nitrososphaerales archaeon]